MPARYSVAACSWSASRRGRRSAIKEPERAFAAAPEPARGGGVDAPCRPGATRRGSSTRRPRRRERRSGPMTGAWGAEPWRFSARSPGRPDRGSIVILIADGSTPGESSSRRSASPMVSGSGPRAPAFGSAAGPTSGSSSSSSRANPRPRRGRRRSRAPSAAAERARDRRIAAAGARSRAPAARPRPARRGVTGDGAPDRSRVAVESRARRPRRASAPARPSGPRRRGPRRRPRVDQPGGGLYCRFTVP